MGNILLLLLLVLVCLGLILGWFMDLRPIPSKEIITEVCEIPVGFPSKA